jgi:hypothetical protein
MTNKLGKFFLVSVVGGTTGAIIGIDGVVGFLIGALVFSIILLEGSR